MDITRSPVQGGHRAGGPALPANSSSGPWKSLRLDLCKRSSPTGVRNASLDDSASTHLIVGSHDHLSLSLSAFISELCKTAHIIGYFHRTSIIERLKVWGNDDSDEKDDSDDDDNDGADDDED